MILLIIYGYGVTLSYYSYKYTRNYIIIYTYSFNTPN